MYMWMGRKIVSSWLNLALDGQSFDEWMIHIILSLEISCVVIILKERIK